MERYVVGVYRRLELMQGFKVLQLDTNEKHANGYDKQVADVSYADIVNELQSNPRIYANVKLNENKKVVGVNGSLSRYGTVGKSQAIVILRELINQKGDFDGYLCSDCNGNVKPLTEQETVQFATSIGIANGKVVSTSKGKHISCIEGTYRLMRRPLPTGASEGATNTANGGNMANGINGVSVTNRSVETAPSQPKQQQPSLQPEVLDVIAKLKEHKRYESSAIKDIVSTVEKYNKCSEKQLSAMKKTLTSWTTPSQPKQQSSLQPEVLDVIAKLKGYKRYESSAIKDVVTTVETFNRCSDKQLSAMKIVLNSWISQDKKAFNNIVVPDNSPVTEPSSTQLEYKDYTDVFEFKSYKQNDKQHSSKVVYLASIKEPSMLIDQYVKIPDKVIQDGIEKTVVGIQASAFEGSYIKGVYIGRNITDIGQYAFHNCKRMQRVDMHESRIKHVAMNAFCECDKLEQVMLPDTVERIHEGAFRHCGSLKEFHLPNAVDTVARVAFEDCIRLEKVTGSVTNINESAFAFCLNLVEFDFSQVITIGTHAFRGTGFDTLRLTGNITNIGRKAFADCYKLTNVTLDEGIETLGEYCFAKSLKKSAYNTNYHFVTIKPIAEIMTCKSIKSIGADAFRNVELVKVYTGSIAESQCIGFGIPYERVDKTTNENATRIRKVSEVCATNPMVTLNEMISAGQPGASNPKMELKRTKLISVPMSEKNLDFLKIHLADSQEPIDAHIKFTGFVNYLQDTTELFKQPLMNETIRLCDTFSVESTALYNDGYNRIYKTMYTLLDTLEQGGCIMVLQGNTLIYIAELTIGTDVVINDGRDENDFLPITKFLHAGDKIGNKSTISGKAGEIKDEETGKTINVGFDFYKLIERNSIEMSPQRKDSIWYVPACGVALKLHDKREWEKYDYSPTGKRVSRETQDCLNLLSILTYDELLAEVKKFKKHTIDSKKFFNELTSMSKSEAEQRVKFLSTVEEEKQAQLYGVSKQFIKNLESNGINPKDAKPDNLTMDILNKLSTSYWMISKDERWIESTGTKSLNKTNEYSIGGCKLQEFVSNQVVKFSNPYMNGQKGAYVFKLTSSGRTVGVYASRYSMKTIINKLVALTQLRPETVPVTLMTDPYAIDVCEPDLFYNFYDVLFSKQGWGFKEYMYTYNSTLNMMTADFHIAMYKPTGIFYLTMESYVPVSNTDKKRSHMVMPILPIGNMDRALMIATTTNNKAKSSELLKELMTLAIQVVVSKFNGTMRLRDNVSTDQYYKVREMVINGVKDIEAYRELVNDRIVYMLGTVHHGALQVEGNETSNWEEEVDSEFDDMLSELDMSDYEDSDESEVSIGDEEDDEGDNEGDDDYDELLASLESLMDGEDE